MMYLILSIISSSSIYVIFKLLGRFKTPLFPVIIFNYLIATVTGYLFSDEKFSLNEIVAFDWFYFSVLIGILFITMFYLIGLSTQRAGVTITSISTKISVVFPMLFSIVYYNEPVYTLKIIGMSFALAAIFLASVKGKGSDVNVKSYVFPLVLFVGMGIVDSLVKFNQEEYLQNTGAMESSTITFAVAAIIGVGIQIVKIFRQRKKLELKTLLFGVVLGLANFGSLYFLILALNTGFLDSSIIFAINNTAIILVSALVGRYLFKEKLILLNWLGVFVSIIAIVVLSIV